MGSKLHKKIQSPCVAITARVEPISLSGPDFWLELKKLSGALHGSYYSMERKEKGKEGMRREPSYFKMPYRIHSFSLFFQS